MDTDVAIDMDMTLDMVEDMDMVLGSQWVLLFAEGDSFRLIYAAKHFRFFENGFVYVSFLQL